MLLAAALALTLHGLFFAFGPDLLPERCPATPRHLTLTFSVRQAPKSGPGPHLESPVPLPDEPAMMSEPAREPPVVRQAPPQQEPAQNDQAAPKRKMPPQPPPKVKPDGMTSKRDRAPRPKKQVPEEKERISPPLPVETEPQPRLKEQSGPETGSASVAVAPERTTAATVEQTGGESAQRLSGVPGENGDTGPRAGEDTASVSTPEEIIRARPHYRENPRPEYPRLARRRGYEGTVLLEVLVNGAGKVEDLRLLTSSGYAVLDRSAMKAVRGWAFEPGRVGDRTVDMWVRVPVRFELRHR